MLEIGVQGCSLKFQKEGRCAEKEVQKFACDLPKVLLSTRVKSHETGRRATDKWQAEQFPKLTRDRKQMNYDQPEW